jgi:hypothetical protein
VQRAADLLEMAAPVMSPATRPLDEEICEYWRTDGYQGVDVECGGGALAAAVSHNLALCEGRAVGVLG